VAKADWHIDIMLAIESGNWDRVRELIGALKEYQNSQSQDPGQDERKNRRPSFWKRLGGSQTEKEASGLLARDREGRTPLHLALSSKDTPKDVAVALVQLEPKAAAISNERERLPLHFAVVHQQDNQVLGELIDAYPAALAATDINDKSPLSYAMDMAKHQTDVTRAPRTYWMPADEDTAEARWQEEQGQIWGVVLWLLLSSATHPQSSLSVGGKKPMLVDALLHAAPPAVISFLVGASSMLLSFDNRATAFAGSTLYSCITRHYPLPILKSLAAQCPKDVRIVRDETGMGLVSAQFISGCFEPIQKTGEWKPSPAFCTAFDDSVQDGVLSNDVPAFSDWWKKIEFLIAFCSCDNAEDVSQEHLLHAALSDLEDVSNSDVPPAVIRLLLSIYPKSVSIPDPTLGVSVLALASASRVYIPRQYELRMEGNEKSVLQMIAEADPKASHKRHDNRLPLHVAIESGKTLESLEPLIASYEKSLCHRDPKMTLYPFQQVAAYPNMSEKDSVRWSCVARNKYSNAVWKGLSDRQKAKAVYRVVEEDSLNRLRTTFELLRRQPSVFKPRKSKSEPINVARDGTGMGMVAAHYMTWCYKEEVKGEWKLNEVNMKVLQNTIQEASQTGRMGNVPPDFIAWWGKMKFWIRYCCPSKLEEDGTPFSLPSSDEFLLHAASINSDTPPQIIELLLALYSRSASMSVPGHTKLPLHLIAQTTCYTARPFEDMHSTSVELTVNAYPRAVCVLAEGMLPLHVAIDAGKTWDELRSLVGEEPRALKVREPATGLFPFQLMAIRQTYTTEQRLRFQHIVRNRVSNSQWKRLSAQDVTKEVRRVQNEYQLDALSSIYELLRRDASAGRTCDDYVPVEESVMGGAVSFNETALSLISTGIKESQQDEAGTDLTADDDDDDSVDLEQLTEQFPCSLVRLLTSDASKVKDTDDVFECDALSLFSNVDVMSTLSESFNLASQHSRRHMSSHNRSRSGLDSSDDEDFGDMEDSFGLGQSSEFPFVEDESGIATPEVSRELHLHDSVSSNSSSTESVVVFRLRNRRTPKQPDSDEVVLSRKKPQSSSSRVVPPSPSSSVASKMSVSSFTSLTPSDFPKKNNMWVGNTLLGNLHSSSASIIGNESDDITNASSSARELSVSSMLPGPSIHKISIKKINDVDMMWINAGANREDSADLEDSFQFEDAMLAGNSAQKEGSWEPEDSFAIDYEMPPSPRAPVPNAKLPGNSAQKEEGSWEPEDSFAIDYEMPPSPRKVPVPNAMLTGNSAQRVDKEPVSTAMLNGNSAQRVDEMPPSPIAMLTTKSAQRETIAASIGVEKTTQSTHAPDQVNRTDQPKIQSQYEDVWGPLDETKTITKTNDDAPGGDSSNTGIDASLAARSDSEDEELDMHFDKISMRWKAGKVGKAQPSPSEAFYSSYRSVQSSSFSMATQNSEVISPYKPVKEKLKAPPANIRAPFGIPFVDVLSREELRKKNKAFSKARHAASASNPDDVLAISERKGAETTFRSQPTMGQTLSPRKMKSSWYAMLSRDRKLSCLFCSENTREVLILPCRHLCICRHCSVKHERIRLCPLCQGEVKDRILIF
jgi:hypothetical protein